MKRELFGGFPGGRFIGQEELDGVTEIVKSRSPYRFYGLDLKRRTDELETLCCDIFKRKYALAISSGTAALHTALYSLDISRGDEVIIPAYAWLSNLMAILSLNAVPVIVPIDETLGLDTNLLEKCLTKKTKAIVAVHMRGYPCNLKGILKIGKRYGVKVIEDGAQCIGGKIGELPVGTLGDISILSFQYNKLVTAGEGGVLLTNDPKLYKRAYRFHDLGMLRQAGQTDPEGRKTIESIGLNYRLSELQAAFLIPQLKKMPKILKSLRGSYKLAMDDLSRLCRKFKLSARKKPAGCEPNYACLCLNASTEQDANRAYQALCKLKIPAQKSSRLDGHHFKTWKNYMIQKKKRFRLIDEKRNNKFLNKSFYIEINALPQRKTR